MASVVLPLPRDLTGLGGIARRAAAAQRQPSVHSGSSCAMLRVRCGRRNARALRCCCVLRLAPEAPGWTICLWWFGFSLRVSHLQEP
jgi:hypothetical protein